MAEKELRKILDEEKQELEKQLVKTGVINRDVLVFLRYLDLRDKLFLQNLLEYQRLVRSEEMASIFALAKQLAEQVHKPNIKEEIQAVKEIFQELMGMFTFTPTQSLLQSAASTEEKKIPIEVKEE